MTTQKESWPDLLRHTPLGILSDLDGTLLPFASTPDAARPSEELTALVRELAAAPGVTLFIVSGRPRETLDEFFPGPRKVWLVAEHGAWRSKGDRWEATLSDEAHAVDSLATELARLQKKHPALLLERKTWSLALHFRRVPGLEKPELLVEVASIAGPWLDAHPAFERLWGAEVLEIRPRAAKKQNAVAWARAELGPSSRLLIVGDDVTDEDMFAAAGKDDAAILVSTDPERTTRAAWRLDSPAEVAAFYRWILTLRQEAVPRPALQSNPVRVKVRESQSDGPYRLLIVSNRLPELRSSDAGGARKRNVGGLVSALQPVLAAHNGIWLGWSGHTTEGAVPSDVKMDVVAGLSLAWLDFPEEWQRRYYNGLANTALWPLFHSFPGRVQFSHADWASYESANSAFAAVATKIVSANETIWVHDYHLLRLGHYLRARGHKGRIGLFQHIPFPGPDIFFLLPWAKEVLEGMLAFDLVGFHTRSYVENFLRCATMLPGTRLVGERVVRGQGSTGVGAFPLGIIPEEFQDAGDAEASDDVRGLMRAIGTCRLVLGVDRLDYTKGIPERIDAFGRLLQAFPAWRKNVCLVQVSVPSRADIPEYAEQRSRVENIVGRINGDYGEADWVPIRYLYRSYGRKQLSELYRAADVGYVTPLRDGMNLVAKEFVAAQDPDKPGVLLLSRFAGAADELTSALLTNPWDPEGTAQDLDVALQMPLEERKRRHYELQAVITKTTALTWAEDFLRGLGESR